jgi:exosortase A-associated hydrolase 1
MSYSEEALLFGCDGETLLGVLSLPATPRATAVLIVVGGPQYRAGSHRQFVELARGLAAHGHAVLRFDCRGMGDSSGAQRGFEAIGPDIGAAVAALRERSGLRHVALWGLCDGASAALLYCRDADDADIVALALANPWVRSQASLAATHVRHYYLRRLLDRGFWRKLLRGQVAGRAGAEFLANLRTAFGRRAGRGADELPFQQRMAQGWANFGGAILLLVSGDDLTAREFLDEVAASPWWNGALTRSNVVRHDLAGADHTFSRPADQAAAIRLTAAWLGQERSPAATGLHAEAAAG